MESASWGYAHLMLTLAQSELGETAAKLLREANGRPVVITDGDREVAALVSIEYLGEVKKLALARMEEIAQSASSRVESHAAELGITPDELVDRLLIDRDEF